METLKVDAYMSDGTPYENVEFNENPEPIAGKHKWSSHLHFIMEIKEPSSTAN